MAGLVRFRGVQQMVSRLIQRRSVGTSNAKKSETITTTPGASTSSGSGSVANAAECQVAKPKNWVSYGFSEYGKDIDRHFMHLSFFVSISFVFTFGTWVYMYLPDFRMNDWSQREGYLELRRREQLGLPRIDINLVDPAKVKLPTEEELKGVEVII